jgi:hypothetical protein
MIAIARSQDATFAASRLRVQHRAKPKARRPHQGVTAWEARALSTWLVLTVAAVLAILVFA